MSRRWGKRHTGAGCAGLLLGIATVIGAEVRWIRNGMQRMDEIRSAGLARALEEGPSQLEYDTLCGGGKKDSDEKHKRACARLEFFMKRAKERREAKTESEAPSSRGAVAPANP